MKLEASIRLLALSLNKLDFTKPPPEEFFTRFLKVYKGRKQEGVGKLWGYRRAIQSVRGTPEFKQWRKAFNEVEAQL